MIKGSDETRENPHEPLERAVEKEYAGLPPFLSFMDVVDCVGIPSLDLSHLVVFGCCGFVVVSGPETTMVRRFEHLR